MSANKFTNTIITLSISLVLTACETNSNGVEIKSSQTVASASNVLSSTTENVSDFQMQHMNESVEFNDENGPSTVLGGLSYKVFRSSWPATIQFSNGSGRCTATFVGPRAVLVAAHCGPYSGIDANSKTWNAWIYNNQTNGHNTKNSMVCTNSPNVKFTTQTVEVSDASTGEFLRNEVDITNVEMDFALCLLEHPIKLNDNQPFETIQKRKIKKGKRVLLHGFGCKNEEELQKLAPREYGTLRAGFVKIRESQDDRYIALGQTYLCPGDSGGAAFVVSGKKFKNRKIVGVNSMVGGSEGKRISILADVSSKKFRQFAKAWSDVNEGTQICGIAKGRADCR